MGLVLAVGSLALLPACASQKQTTFEDRPIRCKIRIYLEEGAAVNCVTVDEHVYRLDPVEHKWVETFGEKTEQTNSEESDNSIRID